MSPLTRDELDLIDYALRNLIEDKADYRDRYAPGYEVEELNEVIEDLEALHTKVMGMSVMTGKVGTQSGGYCERSWK